MKIIIPMSGTGDRYIRAGYKQPKPLIEVDGKPMIEHVVRMFPGEMDFLFICNREHLRSTNLAAVLKSLAPQGRIVEIDSHKLGPVYATLKAADLIDDDQETIVNYCDFSVYWDYPQFKAEMRRLLPDGCVTAYKGFHPHSLGNTYYAYLREKNNEMLEIKEKASFTNNRMDEYASAGTYYFAKGRYVKKYFKALIDKQIDLNGEFYVSLVYNLLKADGLKTHVYPLEHFLQWGTPEDLEEYQYWSDYFQKDFGRARRPLSVFDGVNILPMAGAGVRFSQEGYALPKPLIPVDGVPMILQAVRSLPEAPKWVFLCRKEHVNENGIDRLLKESVRGASIITVDRLTEGQACTCLLSEPAVDPETPLLIGACDNGMAWDEEKYEALLEDPSIQCVVWTFRRHVSARRNPRMYGWVRTNGLWATDVSVKIPISETPQNDHAIVGTFYFRKAKYFFEAAKSLIHKNNRVNNEFYVDSCINEVLAMGLKTAVFEIDKYIGWGTPNDLRTYEYWYSYFSKTGQLSHSNRAPKAAAHA